MEKEKEVYTSGIGSQMLEKEIETLIDIIYLNGKNPKVGKRAGTTVDKKLVHHHFKNGGLGYHMNKIELYGVYEERILKAHKTKFAVNTMDIPEEFDFSKVIKKLENNSNEILKTLNNLSKKELKIKNEVEIPERNGNYDKYRNFFQIFSKYGSELKKIYRTIRGNENFEEISYTYLFVHKNEKVWKLELPYINNKCVFVKENNLYSYMPLIKNLEEYLKGNCKNLILTHPIEHLSKKLLEIFTDENGIVNYLSQEYFDKRVSFLDKTGRSRVFQQKIADILNNRKQNFWDETSESPIMWVDKHLSPLAIADYELNIGLFAEYDILTKYELIPGLDLLTGSTSLPGKRCKVSIGYKLGYIGNELCIVEDNCPSKLHHYFSEYKFNKAGSFKTSSKRDNSCTIRATYKLVKKQTYRSKVNINK